MCRTSPRKRLVKRRTKRFRGNARGRLPFQCPESSAPGTSTGASRALSRPGPVGACRGDALYDLAVLTLGHQENLGDVVAGYGTGVDLDVIRAWWSLRSLCGVRWLVEHGFDPFTPGCEVDVLRSL